MFRKSANIIASKPKEHTHTQPLETPSAVKYTPGVLSAWTRETLAALSEVSYESKEPEEPSPSAEPTQLEFRRQPIVRRPTIRSPITIGIHKPEEKVIQKAKDQLQNATTIEGLNPGQAEHQSNVDEPGFVFDFDESDKFDGGKTL